LWISSVGKIAGPESELPAERKRAYHACGQHRGFPFHDHGQRRSGVAILTGASFFTDDSMPMQWISDLAWCGSC
jgi:hypothetical protein